MAWVDAFMVPLLDSETELPAQHLHGPAFPERPQIHLCSELLVEAGGRLLLERCWGYEGGREVSDCWGQVEAQKGEKWCHPQCCDRRQGLQYPQLGVHTLPGFPRAAVSQS